MAAITICSDFGAPKIKSLTVFTVSPSICHEVLNSEQDFIRKLIILRVQDAQRVQDTVVIAINAAAVIPSLNRKEVWEYGSCYGDDYPNLYDPFSPSPLLKH